MNPILLKLLLFLLTRLFPGWEELLRGLIGQAIVLVAGVLMGLVAVSVLATLLIVLWFGRHRIEKGSYPRNAWAMTWFRPRQTIRAFSATNNPGRRSLVVGGLYGAVMGFQLLTVWQYLVPVGFLGQSFLIGSFLSIVAGVLMVVGAGALIPPLATLFGRDIDEPTARAAFAWSRWPAMLGVVTVVPQVLLAFIINVLPPELVSDALLSLQYIFVIFNIGVLGMSTTYLLSMIEAASVPRRARAG